MGVHRSRVHGVIDELRLFNHLRYRSQVCRLNVKLGGPLISAEDAKDIVVGLREANRALFALGLRPYAATEPVFRLTGPLPLSIVDPDRESTHHLLGIGRRHYG